MNLFSIDVIVPNKHIQSYPNNKPWVTKDLKVLMTRGKKLLLNNDGRELNSVQRDDITRNNKLKNDDEGNMKIFSKVIQKVHGMVFQKLTGMHEKKIHLDQYKSLTYPERLFPFTTD